MFNMNAISIVLINITTFGDANFELIDDYQNYNLFDFV